LNFADRYVPAAVKTSMEEDLSINDWQSALPSMAMTAVFTVASLIFGLLADREVLDRRIILASGIAFWSFATALSGFSQDLDQLILFRSLVGVGEASFATVASPMIADFYPGPQRNRAYTIFGLSAPVGAAIGFGIGSMLGAHLGWRYAFFVCGFPGVMVAFTVLLLNDPPMGINDSEEFNEDTESDTESSDNEAPPKWFHEVQQLLSNKYFFLATMGSVAIQFALGGLTEWYPTFLVRFAKMPEAMSGLVLSGSCIVSGIGGTVLGSKVADSAARRIGSSAYFLVPAAFMVPATGLVAAAVNLKETVPLIIALLLGETCFFSYQAPITALSMSVIPVHTRARGSSLQILLCHVLGDVISPPIIGKISVASSLRTGLQLPWVAVLLAGLFWGVGYACLAAPDIPIKPKSNDQGTLCALLTRGMSCLENFCDDEDEDEENQDENPNEKKEGDPSLP